MNRRALYFVFLLLAPLARPASAEPARRLLLTFLGDIMAHTVNYRAGNYADIYRPVRWLLERDSLTFANLESPVDPSREYSTYPRFNVGLGYLRAAAEAGIEVFSLANNHAYDQGAEGIERTLRSLDELRRGSFRRLHYSGIRADPADPFRPTEITVKGARIGFLAVSQALNERIPFPYVLLADYENERQSEELVILVRALSPRYDLFILSYHGGREYVREPERARMRLFRRLLAAGADIVYGHHPHVPQGYELVEREEGRGLIMYSAGNFISGMTWGIDPEKPELERAWTGDSLIWVVSVSCAEGLCSVDNVWPVPVTNVRDRLGTMTVSTFPGLSAHALAGAWTGYYRERSRRLAAQLRIWERQSVDPVPVR